MNKNVIFVAPFLLQSTLRFVKATGKLPGVRLIVVSQDPAVRLPSEVAAFVDDYFQVDRALEPACLIEAGHSLVQKYGAIHRILGIFEQLQVPLAEMREALGVEGTSVQVAQNFRDKNLMKSVLKEAGIPCARHRLVSGKEEALEFVREVGFPLIVKPPAGAGAKGIIRAEDESSFSEALAMHRPMPGNEVLLEEFMTGEEQSFDTITVRGEHVWHSLTHYRPTPLLAVENPWIQWCVLLPREIESPQYDEIRSVATAALDALGMEHGLSHMEWFRRPDGSVAVSEVGARPPGAAIMPLMSWANNRDFYLAWCNLMVHGDFQITRRRFATGSAFLRGQGEGRVVAVHGYESIRRELGDMIVEANLPQPGQPRSSSYEGEGNIIVRHPQTDVVEKALNFIISNIRVEVS